MLWIGEGLTPWLEPSLESLHPQAEHVELLQLPEIKTFAFRENEAVEPDVHDREDKHGHDEQGDIDPHDWLSPDNEIVWLDVIAAKLSAQEQRMLQPMRPMRGLPRAG